MTRASLHNDIATTIRDALLPQRFPVRRDVELGAGVSHGQDTVSFHDYMWLGRQVLAALAVRVYASRVEGALAAASLRQLLRASLAVIGDPQRALSECRRITQLPDFDAAVLSLDVNTGVVVSAAAGRAGVEVIAQPNRWRCDRLSAGDIVWIAAGDVPTPTSAEVSFDDLDQFVRTTVERKGSGCATALLFRAQNRLIGTDTFVLSNDSRAIAPILGQVTNFFNRHSIAEQDVKGVDVAIDEVLTNAISHAFCDGNAHEILVTLTIENRGLVIEIRDDGMPFDPLGVPPADLGHDMDLRRVGGLGMHFVRTVMDATAYERSGGWNVLLLFKRLKQAPTYEEMEP